MWFRLLAIVLRLIVDQFKRGAFSSTVAAALSFLYPYSRSLSITSWVTPGEGHLRIKNLIAKCDVPPSYEQIRSYVQRRRNKLEADVELQSPKALEHYLKRHYLQLSDYLESPFADGFDGLILTKMCVNKINSQVSLGFTTDYLINSVKEVIAKSKQVNCLSIGCDARYGQIASQIGCLVRLGYGVWSGVFVSGLCSEMEVGVDGLCPDMNLGISRVCGEVRFGVVCE